MVNNAGILRDKSFHRLDQAMIEAVIQVHLMGAFYVTQPAYQIMREKGFGRIISVTSNSGLLGNFGQANYGAAKMGLVGVHQGPGHRGAQPQHQGQRHRSVGTDPHDRRHPR